MITQQNKKHKILGNIISEVSKAVIGKDDLKELLLVTLLSQGHVLIEGLPGTAKTTLARTFAHVIGGRFKRVQGTPDMLPADILGFYLYRPDGSSNFMPGPVFANVLLADELNRISPRTQAALLEAMQEQQVTIERETHPLEQPFLVIASQIPYGGPGTSPLSEVQVDRFMFRIWSALPSMEEEDRILQDIDIILEPNISPVTTPDDILQLQQEVKKVYIADNVRRYILDIIDGLRHHPDVPSGPSPRASITLFKGARALAFVRGRDFVIPDDVKQLLVPTLTHRLRLSAEAEMENITAEAIISEIADKVITPKEGVTGITWETGKAPEEVIEATTKPPDEPENRAEETNKTEANAMITGNDEAHRITGEVTQESVGESGIIRPEETQHRAQEASRKIPRLPLKTLPEWEWILVIFALVVATVMISVGLLSFR